MVSDFIPASFMSVLVNVDTSSVFCLILVLHIFNDTNLGMKCLSSMLDMSMCHCLITMYCTGCQLTSIRSPWICAGMCRLVMSSVVIDILCHADNKHSHVISEQKIIKAYTRYRAKSSHLGSLVCALTENKDLPENILR